MNVDPKFLGAAAFDPTAMTIHISKQVTPLHNTAKVALLHEMIHVKLYSENGDADEKHGARFQGEIKRLFAAGAYDGLL